MFELDLVFLCAYNSLSKFDNVQCKSRLYGQQLIHKAYGTQFNC